MVTFILEDPVEDVNLDLIEYTFFESQTGMISVVLKNGKIIRLDIRPENTYEAKKRLSALYPDGVQSDKPFRKIRLLLDRYLKGEEVKFDIDIDISGSSPFTRKVLLELRKIPYGRLQSYLSIGKQLGYPMAARAIGQAVGRNPIPIIIPCHRVIREDGSLGGFSLGKEIKKRLLVLEGVFDNINRARLIKT
jgi:methylated-DNA-[protein]-cysteine S-methyltransferase